MNNGLIILTKWKSEVIQINIIQKLYSFRKTPTSNFELYLLIRIFAVFFRSNCRNPSGLSFPKFMLAEAILISWNSSKSVRGAEFLRSSNSVINWIFYPYWLINRVSSSKVAWKQSHESQLRMWSSSDYLERISEVWHLPSAIRRTSAMVKTGRRMSLEANSKQAPTKLCWKYGWAQVIAFKWFDWQDRHKSKSKREGSTQSQAPSSSC